MIRAGTLIQPLINLMRDRLLDYDIVQMDETPVQVLNEVGKRAQSKSYIWVQRGGPPAQPVVLYDYDPGRGAGVPKRLLEGFKGYLQTDGYDGYNAVVAVNGLTHLGCMAHARRRFNDAVKAQGRNRKLTPDERYAHRQKQARPVLDEMRAWLDEALPLVSPSSTTGKALSYLHNEWKQLTRYLDDGRLEIDNNGAENAIRPFVLGRKNWLFSASVKLNCRRRKPLRPLKHCYLATSIRIRSGPVEQACRLLIAYSGSVLLSAHHQNMWYPGWSLPRSNPTRNV